MNVTKVSHICDRWSPSSYLFGDKRPVNGRRWVGREALPAAVAAAAIGRVCVDLRAVRWNVRLSLYARLIVAQMVIPSPNHTRPL